MPSADEQSELRCSFCNKSQRQVRKIVAGPNVQICDECIDICVDILAEDRKDAPATPPDPVDNASTSPSLAAAPCALCHMTTPGEHLIAVDRRRGALCPGCIGAIEAAVAVAREIRP